MDLIISLIAIFVVYYVVSFWGKRPRNFPPGPPRVPLLGTVLSMYSSSKSPQELLMHLADKYGPLTGLFLGARPCVAVHGYDAVKHVLSREDCSHRLDNFLTRARSFDKKLGILFADGNLWKEHRGFTIRHLRYFGFGKRSMEELIQEQINMLIECLETRLESCSDVVTTGISIQDLIPATTLNTLWTIMSGVQYHPEDPKFQELLYNVNEFFRNGNPTGGGVSVLPFLRFIPLLNSSYQKQIKSTKLLQDYIMVQEQLVITCLDLFLGGSETTSSALAFIFLYLLKFPDKQSKMKQEIRHIVGERRPTVEDATKLHYVQAFIHEVLRHACVVPFTAPHVTSSDTQIYEYSIPKDTFLLISIYSVLMDKAYWKDPQTFRPERFLDEEGKFSKDEHLLIFGFGPRFCLGEPLARNAMFLFLTTILQRFTCRLPLGHEEISMDHLQGLTMTPRPYKISLTRDSK
ncbi:hypothetical protein B566_EDAN000967 [Ephemera danica]|nr:hypothetical protein B566_EDAN000967 [Ephemera danica]